MKLNELEGWKKAVINVFAKTRRGGEVCSEIIIIQSKIRLFPHYYTLLSYSVGRYNIQSTDIIFSRKYDFFLTIKRFKPRTGSISRLALNP